MAKDQPGLCPDPGQSGSGRVADAVRRLEQAWRTTGGADLVTFIPLHSGPQRLEFLKTLIPIDQEYRWKADERKIVEQYRDQWPELAHAPATLARLLEAECLLRAHCGEAVSREGLEKRFPAAVIAQVDWTALFGEIDEEVPGPPATESCRDSGEQAGGGTEKADHPLAVGTRLADRYEIKDVREGGMARVYFAWDDCLHRSVAIKSPKRDILQLMGGVEAFLDEARKPAKLKHPGIVPVYDFLQDTEGSAFVVMEYMEGGSLSESLALSGPLAPTLAAELLLPVTEAVQFIHEQRFVHRDLKPGNILFDSAGQPRVADFGLALHEDVQWQHAGDASGTLPYMAPEQVRGEVHWMDGRTDIWALGIILYELLTKHRPFRGTVTELRQQILHRDPKPPRMLDAAIPAALERICIKCLAKRSVERYQSAAELAESLRDFLRTSKTPLDGTISLRVWGTDGTSRCRLSLNDPGALPLRPNDRVRLEVRLNRPAYVYIVWIDEAGVIAPVYPWTPGEWGQRPPDECPVANISLPAAADEGWTVQAGSAGVETLILLARDTPLPDDTNLAGLLATFPRPPRRNPELPVWFGSKRWKPRPVRHVDFAKSQPIIDPLIQAEQFIAERLAVQFDVVRGVAFATGS